jgi:hypothetical protein
MPSAPRLPVIDHQYYKPHTTNDNFWTNMKSYNEMKEYENENKTQFARGIDEFFEAVTFELYGETYITPNWWTDTFKWFCLAQVIILYFNQIFELVVMIVAMGFEWILALFLSACFLFFPTMQLVFLFNFGL